MILHKLELEKLSSERLMVIPFTRELCRNILDNNFVDLDRLNLVKGISWPDTDTLESLPRVLRNLEKVDYPTGFETWMIVKKDTREIIGDIGFKGFNFVGKSCDLGYGIIEEERKKGFAQEAAKTLIDWAFSHERLDEITACCLRDNVGSINLLTRLNFRELSKDSTMIYWSLLKP